MWKTIEVTGSQEEGGKQGEGVHMWKTIEVTGSLEGVGYLVMGYACGRQ